MIFDSSAAISVPVPVPDPKPGSRQLKSNFRSHNTATLGQGVWRIYHKSLIGQIPLFLGWISGSESIFYDLLVDSARQSCFNRAGASDCAYVKVNNEELIVCAWFSRGKAPKPIVDEVERLEIPGGLWTKCPGCAEIVFTRELQRNMMVCPKCGYHFRLSVEQRLELLCDRHSFEEFDVTLRSNDPLNFKDSVRYKERLKKKEKQSNAYEAVRTGKARIEGRPVMLGVFNYAFIGGSMGVVVGEKLTRMIESAIAARLPVIIVSASGGARMQEGLFSLMQMAKVTAAIERLGRLHLPYISLLTDPTTGGVAASFAMLGDVNIAEPGALIGFAGPRVIEQTIRSKLPEGFQRAEFLVEHGMVDLIAERSVMKKKIATILDLSSPQ